MVRARGSAPTSIPKNSTNDSKRFGVPARSLSNGTRGTCCRWRIPPSSPVSATPWPWRTRRSAVGSALALLANHEGNSGQSVQPRAWAAVHTGLAIVGGKGESYPVTGEVVTVACRLEALAQAVL